MRIKELDDIFKDPSIRVVGIIGDPNQAKSNTIYHLINVLKHKYDGVNIYAYGLRSKVEGVQDIHVVAELETIRDSVIFIDEFYDFLRMSNRKSAEKAEACLRTIYHQNNIIILSGLPHNFNKFVSGLLQAVIYKQCLLEDFVQRSSVQQFISAYSGGFEVHKASEVLSMPKNIGLVWIKGEHEYEVDIPYIEAGDTKRHNKPILVQKDDKRLEKKLDGMIKSALGSA